GDALVQPPDGPRLYSLFCALGFQKLIERLGLSAQTAAAQPAAAAPCERVRVCRPEQLDALRQELDGKPLAALAVLPGLSGVGVCIKDRCFAVLELDNPSYAPFLAQLFGEKTPKAV